MRNIKFLAFWVIGLLATGPVLSQVIPVEPLSRGFFSQPTLTMPYERSDAEVIVVVIMGHPGSFGLRVGDFGVKNTTAQMMQQLVYRTKLKINVVILDSPYPLQSIGARSSSDHLKRIESVIRFYKEKSQLPVWLFGHSDGSISVSEYLNRSEENRKSLTGAILSGGRNETRITEDWGIPTLVVHHEKDGCEWTTFNAAQRYYLRIKDRNSSVTELVTIIGGFSTGAPCSTGHHMYQGAFEETLDAIENFLARHK